MKTRFLLILLVLPCFELFAQSENFHLTHYTNENGLPQNSIKGIELDKRGFLWIGTEAGLVRFDGNRFKLYNQINTAVLKDDRIRQIGLLQDSSIFVEGDKNNLFRVDLNGTLVSHFSTSERMRRIDSIPISSAIETYDSNKLKSPHRYPGWTQPYLPLNRPLTNSMVFVHGRYIYFNEDFELISADAQLKNFTRLKMAGLLPSELKAADQNSLSLSLLFHGDQLFVKFKDWIYSLQLQDQNNVVNCVRILRVGPIPNVTYFRHWPHLNLDVVGTTSDGLYIFKKQPFSNLQFNIVDLNVFMAQAPFGEDGVLTPVGILSPHGSVQLKTDGIKAESVLKTDDNHYYVNQWISENNSGIIEFNSGLNVVRYLKGDNLHIRCFRQLDNGVIWFSDDHQFLGKIVNNQLEFIKKPSALAGFEIISFIKASDHELWIAGTKGLVKMDTLGEHVQVIPELLKYNCPMLIPR